MTRANPPAPASPHAPIEAPIEAEIVEAETPEPQAVSQTKAKPAKTRQWWQVWKRREKKPKRALMTRLFGIGIWGTIKLIILCIVVGFILLTMQFDPASPSFDAAEALGLFVKNAWATAKWTATNFWKPAFAGASLVLPIWVLWRLLTLPFRR